MNIKKTELLAIFRMFSARVDMLDRRQKAFVRLFQSSPNFSLIAKIANVNEATIARRLQKIAQQLINTKKIRK